MTTPFLGEVNQDSERSNNSKKPQKWDLNPGLPVFTFCVLSTVWLLGIYGGAGGGNAPGGVADINLLLSPESTRPGKRRKMEKSNGDWDQSPQMNTFREVRAKVLIHEREMGWCGQTTFLNSTFPDPLRTQPWVLWSRLLPVSGLHFL